MNCCKNTAKPDEAALAELKAEQGVYNLLGLAQRAGRLIGGTDAVQKALASGQVRLVLLAEDLSENSQKRFRQAWAALPPRAKAKTNVWRFGDMERLGRAAGKPPRGVWALADENFAAGISPKLTLLINSGRAVPLDL